MSHRKCTRRRRILAAAVAGAGALLSASQFVQGINIIMSYQAGTSAPPASDPGGTQLQAIMNYIEGFYEDVFEDTHTITINYRWGTQPAGTLAAHTLNSQSGTPNRETAGTIVFSNTVSWFYDATPADNSEFNMTQTLWRDLTATQRNNFYSNFGANIPSTFEAGFTGTNNNSNPNVAGNTDLLSVALHEVGHALGMSAANTATQAQTADGDYDFNSAFVFGQALAADVATGPNIAHLNNSNALMFPSIGTSIRRLPSHSDLFSMASGHVYGQLDVPRREFYGGSNWNTAGNWSGDQAPGSADEVFVRASGPAGEIRTATLSSSGFANILHVLEGSNVDTGAFSLSVFSTINLDGLDTDLFVSAGGVLSASGAVLNNNNQAEFNLLGGVASVGTINNNAEIIGQGTLNVFGRLNNSGSINVSGGTLNIIRSGSGSINLDGNPPTLFSSEPGVVLVTGAGNHLNVTGALTDDFNGDMTIGNSNSVTMNTPWTVGGAGSGSIIVIGARDGAIFLNGGTTSSTAAVLGGSTVTIEGDLNVSSGNFGLVTAPIVFSSAAGGAEVLANGTLELDNTAVYQGGSHTGAGRLIWDGDVIIAGSTTIDVAELDLDGFVPLNTLQVDSGVTLTINSLITDAPSGTINVQGIMNVNGGAWTNDTGTIILNTGVIGGTSTFTNSSTLNVLPGTSIISAPSVFTALSDNTINGILDIRDDTTINGGTWNGSGTLAFSDQTTRFAANTTLNTALIDLDGRVSGNGTVIVNAGVVLTINGALSDTFNSTLTIDSGTVAFNGGAPFEHAGVINLNNTGATPRFSGQPVRMVNGRINSNGTAQLFSGLQFASGTVNVAAGNLTVSTTFAGQAGGTLNKTGPGTMVVAGPQSHAVNSVLNIIEGNVNLNTDAGAGGQNLSIDHNGTSLNFGTSQRLAALRVGTAAFATVAVAGNTSVLRVNNYLIAGLGTPAGTINLTDETMIVDYSAVSPIGQLTDDVRAGYNGGNWNGTGIRSNFAAANPSQFAIGIVEATDIGSPATFAGQPIDATTLIARYTRQGDANLDRVTNIGDFSILAANFNLPGRWARGDFNFDNVVGIADFSLLAANFNLGVPSELARGGDSLIPEPASLATVGLVGLLASRRRRRVA